MTQAKIPPLSKRLTEAAIWIGIVTAGSAAVSSSKFVGNQQKFLLCLSACRRFMEQLCCIGCSAHSFLLTQARGADGIVRVAVVVREAAFWIMVILGGFYAAILSFTLAKNIVRLLSERPAWQGAVGVALLGVIFFLFRLKHRSVYGAIEAVFGVMIGTTTYTKSFEHGVTDLKADWASTNLAFSVLTAGIYLIVRGLDNIHQGVVKDPKDPWAVKLWERLKRRYARRPVQ